MNFRNCPYTKGQDVVVSLSIDKKDFWLPVKQDYIAIGNANKQVIKVRKISTWFITGTEIVIPYFPPDLNNLNNTIKRIEKLLTFM
jgi:hypothetical protein